MPNQRLPAAAPTGVYYINIPPSPADSKGDEVFLAKSDGSEPRRLLMTAGSPSELRWSPGGTILRFTVNDPRTNYRSLWQASTDGSNLHPLLPAWNNPPNECCGNWTPDGRYFVFQAVREGTANVWALHEDGGLFRSTRHEPVQLTTGPMNIGEPVPSRDGKKLFVQGWQPRGELVRYDAKSGQFAPYLSGISAMGFDFSRDGAWVTYNHYPDGSVWRSRWTEPKSSNSLSRPCRLTSLDGLRMASNSPSLVIRPANAGKSMLFPPLEVHPN